MIDCAAAEQNYRTSFLNASRLLQLCQKAAQLIDGKVWAGKLCVCVSVCVGME